MEIPTTGVHHITLIGSNRQDTIDFYQGVLGMPLIFEQPNLDVPEETHLYFDAGDGCLITFFVRERRATDSTPVPEVVGNVHHIAYAVSRETFDRAAAGLEALGFPNTGRVDRGFMDSLYFRDPNGLLLELATYTFEPPPASPGAPSSSWPTGCASNGATTPSGRTISTRPIDAVETARRPVEKRMRRTELIADSRIADGRQLKRSLDPCRPRERGSG